MRILLDECVPRPLRRELAGHDVRTIREMGWAGKKNGELLSLMAGAGFEVLLTVDQNLRYQQNLTAAGVAEMDLAATPLAEVICPFDLGGRRFRIVSVERDEYTVEISAGYGTAGDGGRFLPVNSSLRRPNDM